MNAICNVGNIRICYVEAITWQFVPEKMECESLLHTLLCRSYEAIVSIYFQQFFKSSSIDSIIIFKAKLMLVT